MWRPRSCLARFRYLRTHAQILDDETKAIELLVFEAVLHSRFVRPETTAGQIDRLIAVTHSRNVRVGIVPLDAGLELPPLHGFWLFDDELLSVEAIHSRRR
nr:Scr1 family TA system antitoxin-like transcriptional regulator [Amycolatopsis jejuensis]